MVGGYAPPGRTFDVVAAASTGYPRTCWWGAASVVPFPTGGAMAIQFNWPQPNNYLVVSGRVSYSANDPGYNFTVYWNIGSQATQLITPIQYIPSGDTGGFCFIATVPIPNFVLGQLALMRMFVAANSQSVVATVSLAAICLSGTQNADTPM